MNDGVMVSAWQTELMNNAGKVQKEKRCYGIIKAIYLFGILFLSCQALKIDEEKFCRNKNEKETSCVNFDRKNCTRLFKDKDCTSSKESLNTWKKSTEKNIITSKSSKENNIRRKKPYLDNIPQNKPMRNNNVPKIGQASNYIFRKKQATRNTTIKPNPRINITYRVSSSKARYIPSNISVNNSDLSHVNVSLYQQSRNRYSTPKQSKISRHMPNQSEQPHNEQVQTTAESLYDILKCYAKPKNLSEEMNLRTITAALCRNYIENLHRILSVERQYSNVYKMYNIDGFLRIPFCDLSKGKIKDANSEIAFCAVIRGIAHSCKMKMDQRTEYIRLYGSPNEYEEMTKMVKMLLKRVKDFMKKSDGKNTHNESYSMCTFSFESNHKKRDMAKHDSAEYETNKSRNSVEDMTSNTGVSLTKLSLSTDVTGSSDSPVYENEMNWPHADIQRGAKPVIQENAVTDIQPIISTDNKNVNFLFASSNPPCTTHSSVNKKVANESNRTQRLRSYSVSDIDDKLFPRLFDTEKEEKNDISSYMHFFLPFSNIHNESEKNKVLPIIFHLKSIDEKSKMKKIQYYFNQIRLEFLGSIYKYSMLLRNEYQKDCVRLNRFIESLKKYLKTRNNSSNQERHIAFDFVST